MRFALALLLMLLAAPAMASGGACVVAKVYSPRVVNWTGDHWEESGERFALLLADGPICLPDGADVGDEDAEILGQLRTVIVTTWRWQDAEVGNWVMENDP